MAISPINSVSFRGNRSRLEHNLEQKRDDSQLQSGNILSNAKMSAMSVPVVVLMAMNPSMLNAKEPVSFQPMVNGAPTELYVDAPKSSLIVSESDQAKKVPSYGDWACLKEACQNVLHHEEFYKANTKYHMLFIGLPRTNAVYDVLLFPDWMPVSKDPRTVPGELIRLTYHKLEDGKSFYSAYISDGCDDKNGKHVSRIVHEIRIPDHVAKKMLQLRDGKTEFENKTSLDNFIGYRETDDATMESVVEVFD